MSGIEVIGLISAIITIVERSSKLHSAIATYRGIPKAFSEVAQKLPLVRDILQSVKRHIEQHGTNEAIQAIRSIVESCQAKAARLNTILEEFVPDANASRLKRHKLSIRKYSKGSQVESLIKGLLEDVQLLAGHRAVRGATEEQVNDLSKAVQNMSLVPLPPPDAGSQSKVVLSFQDSFEQVEHRQTKEEVKVVKEQSQEEAKVLATERCLRNLFQTDPLEDKNKLKRKKGGRAAGTCEWIVNTDILVGWLGTTQSSPEAPLSNILWLHGNPGIGKSTMSIFLVEELSNVFSAKPENTLAWFFCDSTVEHRRTATSVLRGLIWQFVQQHPRLLGYVSPKYEERGLKLFESFDALWLIFMNLVKDEATGRKFCVIDALDECDPESQETLLRQLNDTFGLERAIHTQNISILITSRPYSEIREHLEQFTNKDLASFPESQEDIHHLIDNKVADLTKSKRFTAKIAGQVTNILRDRAEGTFLWVGLACDELKNVASKDVIKRLHSLPEGLHALYKKLLDDAVQETNSRDVFRRIMTFVLVAGRPLSVADLATACMLHQDEEDKETREQFARDEIASCRLMVVVQDDHVLLLHQSVKDFLTGSGADYINECDAHAMVAERCVDHFIRHFHTDPGCKLSDDGFLSYSIYSWTYHAARAQSAFIVQDSQAEFFAKDSKCRDHWNEHCRFTYRGRTRFSILHAAAWEGIPALVEFLFRDDVENSDSGAKVSPYVDDEYSNPDCGTPLWVAVMRGHTDVAAKLLEKSVIGKGVAERVLLAALRSRSGEAALLLLDRYRGKITFTEKMMRAVFPNNLGIMKSLLDWGATHVEASDAETNAASCSPPGSENIRAALDSNPHEVELVFTSKAIEAARNYNTNVFGLLFDEHHVTLTEAIARALEGSSIDVKSVMQLRFHRGQKRLAIVDKALLLTMRRSDKWVVGSLLDWTGIRTGARQDVLAAAAMNLRYGGEVVRLLLNRWGDQVTITEVVMKAAMENYSNGKEVIELLLDRPDGQKAITDMAASTAPKQENGNDSAVASPFYYDWDQFPDEVALELNDLAGKLWKLQFSHDGRRLAAVGERATTGALLRKVEMSESISEERVIGFVWAADGHTFVAGSTNGLQSCDINGCVKWTQVDNSEVYALCGDRRWLITIESPQKNTIRVYSATTCNLEFTIPLERPRSVCISKDSTCLVISTMHGTMHLFDLARRAFLHQFHGGTEGHLFTRCVFGGGNETLVLGESTDGHILICDKNSGDIVERLEGHMSRTNAVVWNPRDPSMFASCGDDGTVRIWSKKLLRRGTP